MLKRSRKKTRDINELAASIIETATTDPAPETAPEGGTKKNPNAVALGRLGGKKGGPARAAKLTPWRRRKIAQKAAAARWKKKNIPK